MRRLLLYLVFILVFVGCESSSNTPTANRNNAANPSFNSGSANATPGASSGSDGSVAQRTADACSLLTADEIKSVQGEELKDTKLSTRSDGGFIISQCFFTLSTFTNSISLAVTQKSDEQGARDPREFWDETFNRHEDREREKKRKGEEEEEDEAIPEKVDGVGDEAFWMGSRVGGALYVLKNNRYIRISIGGAANAESKIKRSKELAEKVVARL
jgi:hypothetical protein